MKMGKYRMPPSDAVAAHTELEDRLSKIERLPRASKTSVDAGSLVINGGSVNVKSTSGPRSVFIAFGASAASLPDQVSIGRNTPTGSTSTALQFLDNDNGLSSTIEIHDRQDSAFLSDAANSAAYGMSQPRLQVQFYDANTFTTFTSGTFTNFRSSFWYMYHPHLLVRTLCQVDVGTTGEIRIGETGGLDQLVVSTLGSGLFAYVDLIVDRNFCINGRGSNGNVAWLSLELRRTTGAGNVKVSFVHAIGIDFSYLW